MPAFIAGIHDFIRPLSGSALPKKSWMLATSASMTPE
jgi:hypothetical protein